MYTLSTPRGVLATDQSRETLEKIAKAWPVQEKTRIGEWTAPKEKKHSSRRARRAEDTTD